MEDNNIDIDAKYNFKDFDINLNAEDKKLKNGEETKQNEGNTFIKQQSSTSNKPDM